MRDEVLISIDPGSEKMGICVKSSYGTMVSVQLVATGSCHIDRILSLSDKLVDFINQYVYKDDKVTAIIETPHLSMKSTRANLVLSGAIMVYKVILRSKGVKNIISVNPSVWKSVVGIHGQKNQKKLSLEFAREAWGKVVGEDEADAICMMEAYLAAPDRFASKGKKNSKRSYNNPDEDMGGLE
jgi:Holliday junction resolvasome RuvABC endonuclease subunit